MIKTSAQYAQTLHIIRDTLHRWDPNGLIEGGAPKDEFNAEVEQIAVYLPHMRSNTDTARAISEVFSKAFAPDEFPLENCMEVGDDLYQSLKEAGVIDAVP